MQTSMDRVQAFERALLQVDRTKAAAIFSSIIDETRSMADLEFLTTLALDNIGRGWNLGTVSLAQIYMSGVICEELIDEYFHSSGNQLTSSPKIGIGVLLDHHALGKRIVSSVLRAGGYSVLDLGQGLSVEEMVSSALEHSVDFLLISVLMLPSALGVKDVVASLRRSGYTGKIIVGGAPFRLDRELWKSVEADATGNQASDIISIIQELWEGRQ